MTLRLTALAAALVLGVSLVGPVLAGPISVIDDFNGDLSAYTATRILNASTTDPNNVWQWQITGGSLEIATTTYGGIEQYALTRTDYTLAVGEELQAIYTPTNLNSQDIGLYVGAGTPTPDVRKDYLSIYMRNNGQLYSRGFNGTSEFALSGGSSPTVERLFVARKSATDFDLGYYSAGTRNILVSRTVGNSAIGNAVGFYADVRGAGVRGNMDHLLITTIPEPASLALAGLALAGLLAARKRS